MSGVPYFILSDGKRRIRMSGAQPPELGSTLEQLGAIGGRVMYDYEFDHRR